MKDPITLGDILSARKSIAGQIVRTPLRPSASLSDVVNSPVWVKCEHLQYTGSFKLRGALNAVLKLTDDQKHKGVVGVSTGNYGRALAYAAQRTGVRAVICMSELVPANKVDAIRALGAEICITGKSQDEAQHEVDRLVATHGMTMLPPFDHADIIAGQGTLGLEILEDLPDAETLLVPLSGGGLLAGVALAAKSVNPAIRVVGISMERGCAMIESLQAGQPVSVEELPTLADSLGGGIGLNNQYTFDMCADLTDDFVLVNETQIADAIRAAYQDDQYVLEGAGAVGIAALRAGLIDNPGRTVVLATGCNIDMALHRRITGGENVDLGTAKGAGATT
ncbi:hydroxyectoine utilization dehydratase EutB [Thalassospira sp.]|uniref:hydroxyectoine utilization dehydratase EutB n=1 Tax=Thalassospira sp. TaxID=1912094 RepID=UPI0027333C8A|nr:hydroxyectoine utilization dehydratase EutB [Thalassospira sp.]MDP2696529.1 hydroxyectoine utilization dehydratase EutB [Thalassospira sp.]